MRAGAEKSLSRSEFIQVSIMLFGLFFGAGNLIFPAYLGNLAGKNTMIALIAFSITAIVFPILGVYAVSKSEGLLNLANRINPTFSLIYTSAIFISIGPGLGIPRAGSMPFELAVAPYVPENFNITLARIIYTSVFFISAYLLSIRPNKLVKRMGKILSPSLILLIILLLISIYFKIDAKIAAPKSSYSDKAFTTGFLEGYNTMDAIASLNFGLVISQAIRQFKINSDKAVKKYSLQTGLLAGAVLFLIYSILSYIGKVSSSMIDMPQNGAIVLSEMSNLSLGKYGAILLAVIFTLACLTTCVGLITSGANYFDHLTKEKLGYSTWVVILSLTSFITANFGLDMILKVSAPVLTIIYPVSILLIILGVSHDLLDYSSLVYKVSAAVAVVLPTIHVLGKMGLKLPLLTSLEARLPLAKSGLSWVLPCLVVVVILTVIDKIKVRNNNSK